LSRWFDVFLGSVADEPIPEDTYHELNRLCRETALVSIGRERWIRGATSLAFGRSTTQGLFASSKLRQEITAWARTVRFDAVMAFCSSMVQYARVRPLKDTPLIVDLVDVDSQKWFDYADHAKGPKRWLYSLEGRRVRKLERDVADRAQAITVVSEAEAKLFRDVCPNDRTVAVSNGVDLEYFAQTGKQDNTIKNSCVFVGVLDYLANVEGIRWFCSAVWPEIRRRVSDSTFQIVGRHPVPAVMELESLPGVTVIGEVPDIRPHLSEASVVIAPLQVARGIQNKVLEAMAMSKPVVATPQALEGLDIQDGLHALSAASPDDQADAVIGLFSDGAKRCRIGSAAREFVVERHSWDVQLRPLIDLLQRPNTAA
jgi:sugar transferase (PEP-CTERM/EpsH1 system associated)